MNLFAIADPAMILTALVEDLHAREFGLDAMEGAVALVDWYVSEALRLQQAGRTDTK